MTFFGRVRVLPLLILVATLSFMVRLGEFYAGIHPGSAMAQEEVKVNPPSFPAAPMQKSEENKTEEPAGDSTSGMDAISPQAGEEKKAATETQDKKLGDNKPPEDKPGDKPKEEAMTLGGPPPGGGEWKDSSESDLDASSVKMELFQDLSERRKAIEEKEKQLAAREALLKAGERELDQKFRELTVLKKEIEGLLQQQSDEEQARIRSLVTIYENMKPKEAARVFDTLDMDVLVSIISRMAERKVSPVLAEMNPERARAVTIILAQEKQLPSMPDPGIGP